MKYLFPKGHTINKGRIPYNKGKHIQTNTGKTHFCKNCIPWNKGMKGVYKLQHSGQFKKGNHPKTEFKKGINLYGGWNRGLTKNNNKSLKKMSETIKQQFENGRLKIAQWKKGDTRANKNWNWKGGITPLSSMIRHSQESMEWKIKIFKRNNYICQKCFQRGNSLHIHHIKHFALILQEFLQTYSQFSPIEDKETLVRLAITYKPFWDIDNGITLCEECHLQKKQGTVGISDTIEAA